MSRTTRRGGSSTVVVQAETAASKPLPVRLQPPRPRVKWEGDVVDNEHMGKRSSKVCCIYHKPRAFGESDSESGADSDSDGGFTTDPGSDGDSGDEWRQRRNRPPSPHAQAAAGVGAAGAPAAEPAGTAPHGERAPPAAPGPVEGSTPAGLAVSFSGEPVGATAPAGEPAGAVE